MCFFVFVFFFFLSLHDPIMTSPAESGSELIDEKASDGTRLFGGLAGPEKRWFRPV